MINNSRELEIKDIDFKTLVKFMYDNYGIDLSQKKQLISSRLSFQLKSQGYSSFGDFVEKLITQKNPSDIELIINKLTTNYTFFLREKEHFTFLNNRILPELVELHKSKKSLSIWSAGCSSGEEPYTISIYLKEFFKNIPNWDTRILATDISRNVLSKAQKGVYPFQSDPPDASIEKYFTKIDNSGNYRVCDDIRKNVIFKEFNLMTQINFKTKFDVIFCRNVMIYFDHQTQDDLLKRFYNALSPNGYLIISHSESIRNNPLFKTVAPSIYKKK